MRPLPRRRRTGATAIAAGLLLAWQAVVGRTDACSVSVTNNYNVTISLHSYNGFDHICTDPYETASVPPGNNSNSTLSCAVVPRTPVGLGLLTGLLTD